MLPPPQFPTAGRFFQPSVVNQRTDRDNSFSFANTFASPLVESTMRLLPAMLGLDPQVNAMREQQKMEKRKVSDADLDNVRLFRARLDAGTMSPQDYSNAVSALRQANPDITDSMIAAAESTVSPEMTAYAMYGRSNLNQMGLSLPYGVGQQQPAFAPPVSPPLPTPVPMQPSTAPSKPEEQAAPTAPSGPPPEPTPVPMGMLPEQAAQIDSLKASAEGGYRDPAFMAQDPIPEGMPLQEFVKTYSPRESTHMSIMKQMNDMYMGKNPEDQQRIKQEFDYNAKTLFSSMASLNQAAALAQGKTIPGFDEKWSLMAGMSFDQYGQYMANALQRDFGIVDKDVLTLAENPENLINYWAALQAKSNPEMFDPARVAALEKMLPSIQSQLNTMSPQAREFALTFGQTLSTNLLDAAGKRAEIYDKLEITRGREQVREERGTLLPLEVERINRELEKMGLDIEGSQLNLDLARKTFPLKLQEAELLIEGLRIKNGVMLSDEQRKDLTDRLAVQKTGLEIAQFYAKAVEAFGQNNGKTLTEVAGLYNAKTKKDEELKNINLLWQAAEKNEETSGNNNPYAEQRASLMKDLRDLDAFIMQAARSISGEGAANANLQAQRDNVFQMIEQIANAVINDPSIATDDKNPVYPLLGQPVPQRPGRGGAGARQGDVISLPGGMKLPRVAIDAFAMLRQDHINKGYGELSLESFGRQPYPGAQGKTFAEMLGRDLAYVYNNFYAKKPQQSPQATEPQPVAPAAPQPVPAAEEKPAPSLERARQDLLKSGFLLR